MLIHNFNPNKIKSIFRTYISLWKLFKASNVPKSKVIFILMLTFLGASLEAFFILLLGPFTESILKTNQLENNNLNLINQISNSPLLLLLLIVFVSFFKSSITSFTIYYVTRIITIIRKQLRIKIIDSFLHTSWKRKLEGGKLLDAYLNSTTTATYSIFCLTEIATYSLYTLAILITLLLKVSIDLIIVFLFLGIFYYVIINFLSKKGSNLSFKVLNSNQKLSQLANEVIKGIREIQIFGIQNLLMDQMIAEEDLLVRNESKTALIRRAPTILPSILITLIIIYGYLSRGTDDISSSSTLIVTALVAVQRLGSYLSVIGQKLTQIGTSKAEINFVLELIHKKNYSKGKNLEISINKQNSINIKNLTFNYGDNNPLFKNLNVKLNSGRVIVIAGPSGSGKSSLLSLILKECDPISGNIAINNISLDKISKYSWYENISFVSQAPFIFGTSISNNLKFGKSDATFQDIIKASKESGSFNYINKLPNKFEFNVQDGGTNLSGGQCQLISLTRAILKDSPIVLLDEPSNNLDNKSIIRLKNLFLTWAKKNKLVIVITHDLRLIDKRFDTYNVKNFNLLK